jgi:DUF971 family protein
MDDHAGLRQHAPMRPVDMQPIGNELAIKWDDGSETYLRLEAMRRACPCAGCQGEMDVMGHLHKGPEQTLTPTSFQLAGLQTVGSYAVQPIWADGHNTGIFTFEFLRELAGRTAR